MSNVKTRPITEQSGCSIAAAFKKLEIEFSYTFSRNTSKAGEYSIVQLSVIIFKHSRLFASLSCPSIAWMIKLFLKKISDPKSGSGISVSATLFI